MSDDRVKIVGEISGLATAIVTAYVKYINEHQEIDNASVLTACATFAAIITDTLSFREDDPSEAETLALLFETVIELLSSKGLLRSFASTIVEEVTGVRQ